MKRLIAVVIVVAGVWMTSGAATGQVIESFSIDEVSGFSPNGDGKTDTLGVRYKLLDTASVVLVVLAKDSVTVVDTLSTVTGQVPNVEFTAQWDGKDFNGAPVPEDTFLVWLHAMGSVDTSSAYRRVFVDITPPTVVITDLYPFLFAPDSPDSSKPDEVTIGYTLSDPPPSSVLRVLVTIHDAGGSKVHTLHDGDLAANGAFEDIWDGTAAPAVSDQIYELRITATDRAGNSTRDVSSINVDKKAPDMSITSPASDMTVQTVTDSLIKGWVYDRNGIDSLQLRYDASRPFLPVQNTMTIGDTIFFDAPLADSTTQEKTYSIRFRAVDKAGRRTEKARVIHVDRTAPPVPVLDSPEGETRNPLYTVSGSVAPDYKRVRIFRNGTFLDSLTPGLGSTDFTHNVTLVPGSNRFTATALDEGGNESAPSNAIVVTYQSDAGLFIRQPFVPNDEFQINLDKPAQSIRLRLYDIGGRLVNVLKVGTVATSVAITWDGRNGDFEIVHKGPLVAVAEIHYTDDDKEVMRQVFLFQP